MQDLEEDPSLRSQINMYKDQAAIQAQVVVNEKTIARGVFGRAAAAAAATAAAAEAAAAAAAALARSSAADLSSAAVLCAYSAVNSARCARKTRPNRLSSGAPNAKRSW